jgi:hypothetical protein
MTPFSRKKIGNCLEFITGLAPNNKFVHGGTLKDKTVCWEGTTEIDAEHCDAKNWHGNVSIWTTHYYITQYWKLQWKDAL